MTEVATPRASSRSAVPDGPSIDDLLKSGTFHQRLAAARAARERVLAARDEAADQFFPGPKPWERPEYVRGEPPEARDIIRRRTPKAARPKIRPPAAEPVMEAAAPAPVAAPVPEPVPAVIAARAGRLRILQVAGGAAFGIAVGLGAGYWFAHTARQDVVAAAARSTPASAGGAAISASAAANPAATAPKPDLSNVASVSATMAAKPAAGPVATDAVLAPRITAPSDADATVPRLTAASAAPALPLPAPGLRAAAGEAAFTGPEAPVRVSFTLPRAELPSLPGAGTVTRPDLPQAISLPAALRQPAGVAPAAPPGDMPLATQDLSPPLVRAAPGDAFTLAVHAPATVSDADIEAAATALSDLGIESLDPKSVDFTVSETNVRYYFAQDAETAGRVAEALGARLRDFTDYSPRPPQGTVELWLAGKGQAAPIAAAKPVKARKKRAAAAAPSPVDVLKARLVQQLRAGALN